MYYFWLYFLLLFNSYLFKLLKLYSFLYQVSQGEKYQMLQ